MFIHLKTSTLLTELINSTDTIQDSGILLLKKLTNSISNMLIIMFLCYFLIYICRYTIFV